MMPDAVLAAQGLSKRYRRGGPWALDGIDLEVPAGSVTALVGPNGAGKSTLIRAWVGLERPSSGRVTVWGTDPWRDRPAALGRVGYVAQGTPLYRDLTVADHLDLAASLRRGFDRAAANRWVDGLGLPLGRRTSDLSGGQQAQVALVLALGTEAPALLLDEPLASLDPLARREFLAVAGEVVRSTGATVILSSHVVGELATICDRLVVLGNGHIALDGTVAAERARHRIVAGSAMPASGGGGVRVATFLDGQGHDRTLLRSDDPALAPADLEDLVLGYLAAGRLGSFGGSWWAR